MNKFIYISSVAILLSLTAGCSSKDDPTPTIIQPGGPGSSGTETKLSAWTEGELDIHFINTTPGECAFIIMPDGTQMLVDVASAVTSDGNSGIKSRWNPTKRGSQIISEYISKCMEWTGNNTIDYFMITHFHADHMGTYLASHPKSSHGNWTLNGATEILEKYPVGKLVDRGYPDYNYPYNCSKTYSQVPNYRTCADWFQKNQGLEREIFKAGSATQFKELRKPSEYPVTIRNISCNGQFWTGAGENVTMQFPKLEEIPAGASGASTEACPCENSCSGTIKITYGQFDAFLGGDTSVNGKSYFAWKDTEKTIAGTVGQVEVMKANHHGSVDADYPDILNALSPQVMVINVWQDVQPRPDNTWNQRMGVMTGTDFYMTNLASSNKSSFTTGLSLIKSEYGHVVVRVQKGGLKYKVYALDDQKSDFSILKSKEYTSR